MIGPPYLVLLAHDRSDFCIAAKISLSEAVFGGVKNVSAIVSERKKGGGASNSLDQLKCNFCGDFFESTPESVLS